MSGMCKSDQRQNSRMKNKYQAWANQNTWETHKAKRMKRDLKRVQKRAKHHAKREALGKPFRGQARAIRRHGTVAVPA